VRHYCVFTVYDKVFPFTVAYISLLIVVWNFYTALWW